MGTVNPKESGPSPGKPVVPQSLIDDVEALLATTIGIGATELPPDVSKQIREIPARLYSSDSGELDSIPSEIGAYVILEPLGSGGMGDVFRGRHKVLGNFAAIKLLSPQRRPSANSISRFYKEMQTLAALNHPNLVSVYDGGAENEYVYMVMEIVPGRNLREFMTGRSMTVTECCEVMRQVALGLDEIHRCGLVHRDVKPSNIMITTDGSAKLIDLGLARIADDESDMTQHGATVGTRGYMSPEQLLGQPDIDHRTDLFALGCTFQALLCAQGHWDDGDAAKKSIPHEVIDLIESLSEEAREKRLSSASAFAESISPYCESHSATAPKRYWQTSWFVLVALVGIALIVANWFSPQPGSKNSTVKEIGPSKTVQEQSIDDHDIGSGDAASPETKLPPIEMKSERELAEYWVRKGASVKLHVKRGESWSTVTVDSVDELPQECRGIQTISLPNTNVSGDDLRAVGKLRYLQGFRCGAPSVTDDTLRFLNENWELKWVYLSGSKITDNGIGALGRYRAVVENLDVSYTAVSDQSMGFLSSFPNLRELNVAKTSVADAGASYLPHFSSLVSLDLSRTAVTDQCCDAIAKCKQLKRLKLVSTSVSDIFLSGILQLSLTDLDVRESMVSNKGVQTYSLANPACNVRF